MKPVFQQGYADCFAASIATILDLPLPVVPAFADRTFTGQAKAMGAWLKRLGLTYLEIPLPSRSPSGATLLGVLTAEVPQCGTFHAVVASYRDGRVRVVHDPQPGGPRLGRKIAFGLLIPRAAPRPLLSGWLPPGAEGSPEITAAPFARSSPTSPKRRARIPKD